MKREWYKKGIELLNEIKNTKVASDEVAIWFLGQCGFVIKQESIIYIDPVINDIKDEKGNSKRLFAPPFLPGMVEADYVICTHKHADHMAKDTICGIYNSNENVKFILPGICKDIVMEWGISAERIIEARRGNKIMLGDVVVEAVSTAHPNHKVEPDGREWNLAYDIMLGNIHVLHMGDTYLTDMLLKCLKQLASPNILMVPINGRDYFRELQNIIGNMSEREAALLSTEIEADLTIPMHYDMIDGNTADPVHFLNLMCVTESAKKVKIMSLGERIIYKL